MPGMSSDGPLADGSPSPRKISSSRAPSVHRCHGRCKSWSSQTLNTLSPKLFLTVRLQSSCPRTSIAPMDPRICSSNCGRARTRRSCADAHLNDLNLRLSSCPASGRQWQLQRSVDFNRKLSELGRAKWRQVLEGFLGLRGKGILVDQIGFTIVATAMGQKRWQRSCLLLKEAQDRLLEVNTINVGAVLGACEKSSRWTTTVCLLGAMHLNLLESSLITGNSVINACGGASRWLEALSMMRCMQIQVLEPDHVSGSAMTAALDTLDSGRCWEIALRLLQGCREGQTKLDVVAWTSLSSVCGREGRQWKRCLETLAYMTRLKCLPNAVSYRVGYLACESAEELPLGHLLLKRCLRSQADASRMDPAFTLWALAKLSVHCGLDPQGIHRKCLQALRFLSVKGAAPTSQVTAVCWAASALGAVGKSLEQKLGRIVMSRLHDFAMEELMLVAWGFVGWPSADILHGIQQEACRRLRPLKDKSEVAEVKLEEVLGLVGACALAGSLEAPLRTLAAGIVRESGRHLDALHTRRLLPLSDSSSHAPSKDCPLSLQQHDDRTDYEPVCKLDVGGLAVVYKPPGWEVHDLHEAFQLHAWFQRHHLHLPILHDSHRDFGFLHRLDVPSSGLLLVAKTFEAFQEMQFQLAMGELARAYAVLCHGWLPKAVVEFNTQLRLEGQVSLSGRGKPCRTLLHSRRHLSFNGSRALSLVNVTIATGRMHQIRCHFAHAGAPTVSDGKYTSESTFGEDLHWCMRNFLHRHRMSFRDLAGRACVVTAPLAKDLQDVLESMAVADKIGEGGVCL